MKNWTFEIVISSILLVFFGIFGLVIPIEKTVSFWISFGFIIGSLSINIIFDKFFGDREKQIVHLSLILAKISCFSCLAVLYFIFLFICVESTWIAIVTEISVIFVFNIVFACIAKENDVLHAKSKIQNCRHFLYSMQIELELLAKKESNLETKSNLIKLAEKVKFSDPSSSPRLMELENNIRKKVDELKNLENLNDGINELNFLIDERNMKCKEFKNEVEK